MRFYDLSKILNNHCVEIYIYVHTFSDSSSSLVTEVFMIFSEVGMAEGEALSGEISSDGLFDSNPLLIDGAFDGNFTMFDGDFEGSIGALVAIDGVEILGENEFCLFDAGLDGDAV